MSANTTPTKSKSSFKVILLTLIALASVAGSGYGCWVLYKNKYADSATAVEAVPTAPIFMPLDPFTVNLITSDNHQDRVLYIGLTLRLPDEATRKQLSDYLPEVRSRLLLLLSHQEANNLVNEVGKQRLVAQIKSVLNPPLVKGKPHQVINDVLFTAFILR